MTRTATCYAQRMLNPYHGVINVVESDSADAVTRDGIEWMLYLQGQAEEERLEDGTVARFQTPDIKYGNWSKTRGLKRAPVRSVVDFDKLEARGQALLEAVKAASPRAPFALRDHFEYWLLEDDSKRPVAMIDSSCGFPEAVEAPPAWRPGQASHREFVSARLEGAPTTGLPLDLTPAARLARAVNRAAGRRPVAQWFRRLADGRGVGVLDQHLPSPLRERTLGACEFPELMLATDWKDQAIATLAEDFLAWQAPWLLQLQRLSKRTRSSLERAARQRAGLTASLHHLYPEVVDAKQIRAALVEARLREGEEDHAATRDDAEPTFYIEMCEFTVGN